MFTGIVQHIAKITRIDKSKPVWSITIQPALIESDLIIGESICISGICLSVVAVSKDGAWLFECMPETILKTAIQDWTIGGSVNCERAMKANDRFGGHIVQGHCDSTGKITSITAEGESCRIRIDCDPALASMIVTKGFITIDGASLTIVESHADYFTIALIPITGSLTIAGDYCVGQTVNLEIDIFTKTIAHLLKKEPNHES